MKDSAQRPQRVAPVPEDVGVIETNEWLEALVGVARVAGQSRVRFLLQRLAEHASRLGVKTATRPLELLNGRCPAAGGAFHLVTHSSTLIGRINMALHFLSEVQQ